MKHSKALDTISFVLLIIGGLCWGLIGLFDMDLIGSIFNGGDGMSSLTRIIYVAVGLSALYRLYMWMSKK